MFFFEPGFHSARAILEILEILETKILCRDPAKCEKRRGIRPFPRDPGEFFDFRGISEIPPLKGKGPFHNDPCFRS